MKNFKEKIKLTGMVALAIGFYSTQILAGVGSSGGGASVVCRDGTGKIQKAEILDLVEARDRYAYQIASSAGTIEEDYIQAVKRTYSLQGGDDILMGSEERLNLRNFFQTVLFTKPGAHLPLLSDLGKTITPNPGCAIEQLAIFHDDETKIDVDSEIWSALDSLNQAALVTHELFYKYERELAETTSEGTRAAVAAIYAAPNVVHPVLEGLAKAGTRCFTMDTMSEGEKSPAKVSAFYILSEIGPDSKPVTKLQFTQIMGRPVLAKATAQFADIGWVLAFGDPDQNNSPADPEKFVVWEKGAQKKIKVPVLGSQRNDLEIEMEYIYAKPVKIGLYQKGVLLEEAYVAFCAK